MFAHEVRETLCIWTGYSSDGSTLRLHRSERGSANSTGSDELMFITWVMLVSIVVVDASGTREKTAIALPRAETIEHS
jgi:hypothetical protein